MLYNRRYVAISPSKLPGTSNKNKVHKKIKPGKTITAKK